MALKCYGYSRVSGVGQQAGHGPERQREIIRLYCEAQGYELVGFFDDAHTGTEADRPQFVAMLQAMLDNGVKTVVVESLDRLARDLMIQCTLLAKLSSCGLTLMAANTGENVTQAMQDDPMRKAMVQIQGVFAELEKSLLVRKLRKARDQMRAKAGRCEGRKPYGAREGEEAVLDRIRRLRRKPRIGERMPVAKVAETLNAEGFTNRSGKPWTEQAVRNVVRRALT